MASTLFSCAVWILVSHLLVVSYAQICFNCRMPGQVQMEISGRQVQFHGNKSIYFYYFCFSSVILMTELQYRPFILQKHAVGKWSDQLWRIWDNCKETRIAIGSTILYHYNSVQCLPVSIRNRPTRKLISAPYQCYFFLFSDHWLYFSFVFLFIVK